MLRIYKHPEPYKVLGGGDPKRYGWLARRSKALFMLLDDENELVYGLQDDEIGVVYPPPQYTYETAQNSIIRAEGYIESSWFEVMVLTGLSKQNVHDKLNTRTFQEKVKKMRALQIEAAENAARIKRKVDDLRDADGIPSVYEDVDEALDFIKKSLEGTSAGEYLQELWNAHPLLRSEHGDGEDNVHNGQ